MSKTNSLHVHEAGLHVVPNYGMSFLLRKKTKWRMAYQNVPVKNNVNCLLFQKALCINISIPFHQLEVGIHSICNL